MNGTQNEKGRISDWLMYEEGDVGRYSRDVVTVATNQTLADGAVVGKNAAGEIVEYDNTDPDGGSAVGIMIGEVTTTDSTAKGVMLARHARVNSAALTWKMGLVADDKTAAMADLKAVGIIDVPSEV